MSWKLKDYLYVDEQVDGDEAPAGDEPFRPGGQVDHADHLAAMGRPDHDEPEVRDGPDE
jgi:hypothetical protein